MIGRTEKTASPTVLFISENDHYRKEAREVIKESGILKQHPGFKTAHTSRDPGWEGPLEQLGLCQETKGSIEDQEDGPEREVFYEYTKSLRPAMPIYILHGSSIRVATANVILLEDRLFYLAPSHVFFDRLDNLQTSQLDDDFEIDSETETEYEGGVEASITSMGSQSTEALSDHDDLSDNELHSKTTLDSPQLPNSIASSPRPRRLSNSPFAEEQIRYPQRKVTTPSRASLRQLGILFDWCVDQDWALVEVIERGDINDRATVITHTASAGQMTGSILGMPSYARLPRGKLFQEVFSIHLDGPLADGDCGSAIFEAETGELFGHIVAGCRSTGFAYVMAARHVFPKLAKSALRIKDTQRLRERCPTELDDDATLKWKGKYQETLLPSEPQSQHNTMVTPLTFGHKPAVPGTLVPRRVDRQDVQQPAGHTEMDCGSFGSTQGLHLALQAHAQSTWRERFHLLDSDHSSVHPMYTAHPPKYGPKPGGSQLSKVYEYSLILLPCEFRKLSGCQTQFALHHKDLWIDHIIDEHLHGCCPRVSVCWFCDKSVFRSDLNHKYDKQEYFRRRMYHIATHFKEGMTAADIRPDFYFLDHLYEHNLIDESTFKSAKKLGEFPGGYFPRPPGGYETQSEVVVESSRSCRRRQSRDYQPGSSTKPNSTRNSSPQD
ncbi:nicotinamide N-methyltransferase [Metarhizium guizhouense ARSEF 977]|uniref:Nicotinamide N-methyltransferase n=1 Tax=Metarhizium guizhouense (strain ARSEF 977) TaxID=1276136 RepID=A0A0B4GU49_METGA|nr:nicotinamide N-methyltransferase [Metarhizium guizhouense ARSEF 977]